MSLLLGTTPKWWMRLLCQYIALRANGEDRDGLGRFWQGRYKAVRILDEESLLACAAYIDLNPIRVAFKNVAGQQECFGGEEPEDASQVLSSAGMNSNRDHQARRTNRALPTNGDALRLFLKIRCRNRIGKSILRSSLSISLWLDKTRQATDDSKCGVPNISPTFLQHFST